MLAIGACVPEYERSPDTRAASANTNTDHGNNQQADRGEAQEIRNEPGVDVAIPSAVSRLSAAVVAASTLSVPD